MSALSLPCSLLLLSLVVYGCGNPDEASDAPLPLAAETVQASSPAPGDAEHIGTISATLDGEARTWYGLAGTVDGEEQATAVWYRRDGDAFTGLIGGYDSPDLDVSTLVFTPDMGLSTSGTYEGSTLVVSFPFERGQSSASMAVNDPTGGDIIYVRKTGSELDMETNYFFMTAGRLELTRIEAQEGGPCRFEGTFHGTLTRMDQAASMTMENGTFDIDGCLYYMEPGG